VDDIICIDIVTTLLEQLQETQHTQIHPQLLK